MSKNIFITATGTDIGKTYISALIVKSLREDGYNCGYFKPVMSGVKEKNGILIESDCNFVVNTADIPTTPNDCVSYWWKEAVSPHLAAKNSNVRISKILEDFNNITKKYDYVLVEGAGGITCPIKLDENNKYLMKDLIKDLNTPILIVADAGLGTINHTLLTVDYAQNNGIKVVGIILNNFDNNNFMHQDNLKQIEYLTKIKVVAKAEKGQTNIKLLETLFE